MTLTSKQLKVKEQHDRKQLRQSLKYKQFRRGRNRQKLGIPKKLWKAFMEEEHYFWDYDKIKAPPHFSLISNTEEVLGFIGKLQRDFTSHKKVFVRLYNVKKITDDAILLLLSNVLEFRNAKIGFNGNRPKDEKVNKSLDDSGFFRILYGDNVNEGYDKDSGTFTIQGTKRMFTHATKSVDSELSESLIEKSAEFLWGEKRRCRGVQRIFLELMQNTNNHASRKPGEKYWWVSVSKLENPKRICFSFIDYGMGIFRSLETKGTDSKFAGWVNKIKNICNPQNHNEVLREMMNGNFHQTVTGKSYRGKGIPGIYNELGKKSITQLMIISNDAFADAKANDYHKLLNPLKGTYVYWEINEQCKNLPLY